MTWQRVGYEQLPYRVLILVVLCFCALVRVLSVVPLVLLCLNRAFSALEVFVKNLKSLVLLCRNYKLKNRGCNRFYRGQAYSAEK
jgi:hypothetical protein